MSDSDIEIVVDDPTAPEADSPAVTSTGVVDVVVSLLLVVLAVTLGYDNWRTGIGWDSTGPQAGYFPFYLSVVLAGASLYGAGAALLSRKEASETFVTRAQLRRVMAVFVPTLLFCLATQFLGLYVASFFLIAAFMRIVGKIALWKSLLTAFVFTAAMFVTFDIAFDVIMPKGPLEAAFGY
jgi:putative tricarboxylic transport membrane protein